MATARAPLPRPTGARPRNRPAATSVRRQMLCLHPLAARKATIRWYEERQRYPHPDSWADLVLLETDDTTPPDASAAADGPDQAFCSVCDVLLPLPEDRQRGYHRHCAA